MLTEFGIRSDGSSSTAPLIKAEDIDRVPLNIHIFMQAEKDAVVE